MPRMLLTDFRFFDSVMARHESLGITAWRTPRDVPLGQLGLHRRVRQQLQMARALTVSRSRNACEHLDRASS